MEKLFKNCKINKNCSLTSLNGGYCCLCLSCNDDYEILLIENLLGFFNGDFVLQELCEDIYL